MTHNNFLELLDDNQVLYSYGYYKNNLVIIPKKLLISQEFFGQRILDLNNVLIYKLPNNIIIHGHLDISNTKIKKLPTNITINGYIDCCGSNISKLYKYHQFHDIFHDQELVADFDIMKQYVINNKLGAWFFDIPDELYKLHKLIHVL